jgi:hypothetical protein
LRNEVVSGKRSNFPNFLYKIFRRDYRLFFIPITLLPHGGVPRGAGFLGGGRWVRRGM